MVKRQPIAKASNASNFRKPQLNIWVLPILIYKSCLIQMCVPVSIHFFHFLWNPRFATETLIFLLLGPERIINAHNLILGSYNNTHSWYCSVSVFRHLPSRLCCSPGRLSRTASRQERVVLLWGEWLDGRGTEKGREESMQVIKHVNVRSLGRLLSRITMDMLLLFASNRCAHFSLHKGVFTPSVNADSLALIFGRNTLNSIATFTPSVNVSINTCIKIQMVSGRIEKR